MNTQIEFMHYRPAMKNGRGGITVGILPSATDKSALLSFARCGPTDNFNKKIGRAIASGRMTSFLNRGPGAYDVREVPVDDMLKLKTIVAGHLAHEMFEEGLE
jgi:hypothetical protein